MVAIVFTRTDTSFTIFKKFRSVVGHYRDPLQKNAKNKPVVVKRIIMHNDKTCEGRKEITLKILNHNHPNIIKLLHIELYAYFKKL